ncbi:hypothetical protein ACFQZC_02250 [Streptacidiphilus monticola]
MHVSWFGGDGFHVVDVWQSQEDFERFVTERLDPVVREKLGVTSNPVVEYSPSTAGSWPRASPGRVGEPQEEDQEEAPAGQGAPA